MFIRGKEFTDGKLIIYKDYETMEKRGSDIPFYISDICIQPFGEDKKSVFKEINFYVGTEFWSNEDIFEYLKVNPNEVSCEII